MALPHFTNIAQSKYVDAIYLNQFEIDFNNKNLTDNCYKIDKKYCYFNANEVSKGTKPVLAVVASVLTLTT